MDQLNENSWFKDLKGLILKKKLSRSRRRARLSWCAGDSSLSNEEMGWINYVKIRGIKILY